MKKLDISWENGKVTYEDRCRVLGQRGLIVWLTGISGAGKSTIAIEVEKRLAEKQIAAYRLDGDNMRHGLNSDLAFSEADRNENIRRIAEVAALLKDAGLITLVSAISPYRKMREFARVRVESGSFMEVYVKADLFRCMERDPKGLYKKAQAGEIENFTALSSPYEAPENPELVLDTAYMSVEFCTDTLLDAIIKHIEGASLQACKLNSLNQI